MGDAKNMIIMILLAKFDWTLPLKSPVLIFSLILFIILFAPIILNRFRIPHLIGLIIAGAIIGPNGLNLMLRDSSIVLFGTVGLLYIMFLAGLEIDLAEFKKNSFKSFTFGMFTFLIPMSIGTVVGLYVLEFSMLSSVLLASMFASHTLIAYPIISKLGVSKNRAVNVAIGGTMITDTLALLVLAVIVGMTQGVVDSAFWTKLGVSVLLFGAAVMFLFPILGRWFFKRYEDSISQYIFVLGMVFLAAFLAETAGIEDIIGAFLAGLALNRLIPHTSPLMNRIEFVGNALFIPFFLIGVGMLIDYKAFFQDFETIKVALVMTVVATVAKFAAAWLTQKTFRFTLDERRLIFGLSNAQAAATLAAVLVGYNIILGQTETGEPIRLLSESVLNGTILMILVTCTHASFVAQKGAQNIALAETADDDTDSSSYSNEERILISLHNPDTIDELIQLSVTLKSKRTNSRLYALNIVADDNPSASADKKARQLLHKAAVSAAATDNHLHELLRYDANIANGMSYAVKEHQITDIIMGLHQKAGLSDSFLGHLTEGILARCNTTTVIYKCTQPLATVRRHFIMVPEQAEQEIGFLFWLIRVWNLGRNTGAKLVFLASDATLQYLKEVHARHPVEAEFRELEDWDDFLERRHELKTDDGLIIIMSRKGHRSYNNDMARMPEYLNRSFQRNNFILVYPMQSGVAENDPSILNNLSILEPAAGKPDVIEEFVKSVSRLFQKK